MSYITKTGEVIKYALIATVSVNTKDGGTAIIDPTKSASVELGRERLELFETLLKQHIADLKRQCGTEVVFDKVKELVHDVESLEPLLNNIRGLLGKPEQDPTFHPGISTPAK